MTESVGLRRRLTLPLVTLYGLGTILGAGIYVLVGKVAGMAGLYAPLAFLLAAAIAALTAYAYARLSARYPVSAGEARYIYHAFGSRSLAGLVGWSIVVVGVTSAATMSRGFAGYLQVFFALDTWLIVTLIILVFSVTSIWGILESVGIAALVTLIEVLGLLFVILMHSSELIGTVDLVRQWDGLGTFMVWNGIILGAVLAFYAFLGFEDIVNVAEEVVEPQKNLPRAIYISLLISGLLYLLVSLISVLVLPLDQLAASEAPMADLMSDRTWARNAISLVSMLAVTNGALIQIIMASRIIYGMAAQGNAPSAFGRVHPRTRTPVRATILVGLLVLGFALWLPLLTLAQLTSATTLFVFALVNMALIKVNIRDRKQARVRPRDIGIPLLGALSCLFLLLYQVLLGF